MTRVRYIVGASLLCSGIAAAQPADPAAPDAPPVPDGTALPLATTGGGDEIISQPMTLPASKMTLYGHLDVAHFSTAGTATVPSVSSTGEAVDVGFGYGVNDKLTVGLTYAFSLHDFEIKGPLTLYGAYSLYAKDKLTVGASANLTIDFDAGADAMGNTTTAETLQAGLGVRYLVAPKIAIFTGGTPLAGATGSLGLGVPNETPIQGAILGQHLTIGLSSGSEVAFDIPVGVGLQATPQIYAWVNTSIGHVKISNTANAFLFADFIPLNVGANYRASKNLEVEAFLTLPDLENRQFDLLFFGIGARYYN
jgi:hypothetical protein